MGDRESDMIKLLIIADDFTGALDTGAQFAKKGIQTYVKIMNGCCFQESSCSDNECQVLVLDIESRHVLPDVARERVSYATRYARENGVEYIYKKTDSTLRGNIGSELTALLYGMNQNELIFIPAFPKAGRVTISGRHLVSDIPLSQTEFAKDLLNPVSSSVVSDIIHEQTDINTREIHLGEYENIFAQKSFRPCISIVDAKSNEDLLEMGALLKAADKLRCLAGCAGFAEMLPELLELAGHERTPDIELGKTLLISGSLSGVARAQVEYAQEECGYKRLSFPLEQMLDDETDCADIALKLRSRFQGYDKIALDVPNRTSKTFKQSAKLALRIGQVTHELLNIEKFGVLIVFGGDTLMGIMEQMNCGLIEPIEEIETGVVLSRLCGSRYNLCIVSKAGGLGEKAVVGKIDQYLSDRVLCTN